jgi:hypothetical protein
MGCLNLALLCYLFTYYYQFIYHCTFHDFAYTCKSGKKFKYDEQLSFNIQFFRKLRIVNCEYTIKNNLLLRLFYENFTKSTPYFSKLNFRRCILSTCN